MIKHLLIFFFLLQLEMSSIAVSHLDASPRPISGQSFDFNLAINNSDSWHESYSTYYYDQAGNELSEKEKLIDELIKKCPAWERMLIVDDESNRLLFDQFEKISKFKPKTIRNLIANFNSKDLGAKLDFHARIFLLNRYLFNVPSGLHDYNRKKIFGGWIIPMSGGKIDILWPFKLSANGELVLSGTCQGYNGPDYEYLKEFDYFYKKYGLRNHNRTKRERVIK